MLLDQELEFETAIWMNESISLQVFSLVELLKVETIAFAKISRCLLLPVFRSVLFVEHLDSKANDVA